jgi:hypothetical protein
LALGCRRSPGLGKTGGESVGFFRHVFDQKTVATRLNDMYLKG